MNKQITSLFLLLLSVAAVTHASSKHPQKPSLTGKELFAGNSRVAIVFEDKKPIVQGSGQKEGSNHLDLEITNLIPSQKPVEKPAQGAGGTAYIEKYENSVGEIKGAKFSFIIWESGNSSTVNLVPNETYLVKAKIGKLEVTRQLFVPELETNQMAVITITQDQTNVLGITLKIVTEQPEPVVEPVVEKSSATVKQTVQSPAPKPETPTVKATTGRKWDPVQPAQRKR